MKKSKVCLALSFAALINGAILPPVWCDNTGVKSESLLAPSSTDASSSASQTSTSSATTGSSSADTEHWPWMEQEKSSSSQGLKPEVPLTDANQSPAKSNSGALKMETPKLQTGNSIPTMPPAGQPQRTAPESLTGSASTQVHAPIKLFGRIEQIETHAEPAFPVILRAQTAKLDTRATQPMQGNASIYSGKVVRSFPVDYSGNWGGTLQIQIVQADPRYYQVDPAEAAATVKALRVGETGAVNFDFRNLGGSKVSLQPAQVLFMVPGSDTDAANQVSQMLGGMKGSPFGGMISQMIQNMPVPITLSYGDNATQAGYSSGVSGNQVSSHVIKNDIRELAPGVLEQQIVTQKRTVEKGTNRVRTGYDETVLRFTQRNASQMLVQAASVDYDSSKRFLMKSVLAGWMTKGQVMNTNPMSAMPQVPGMSGLGGMGGIDLQKMMQGGAPQGGQMPSISPELLKNLFGQ